jgi:acetoin utilization deacetylase AcuC-like enzyme
MKVFYSPEYTRSGYAFDTTRKAMWIADSLAADPIANVTLCEPAPLKLDQLLTVHRPGYVEAVQTGAPRDLAESQGFPWDEGIWPMALASNGGAVAAAVTALEEGVAGSLSSGLHHAHAGFGKGFCTFNGLVIATHEALARGAESVLILDLDAHCGGGTVSLIADEPRIRQVDISVNLFDAYPSSEQSRLRILERPDEYLGVVERELAEVGDAAQRPDLCIYNAGMDPFEGCATGGHAGITREILESRERLVFRWCREHRIPIAFVLAGGYVGPLLAQDELVALHRMTLAAAIESRQTAVATENR